ncbi:MAG TPA: PLP-dependent aminotransferase family protein [Myxococcota bacterium]|nr:PLP-dependent aminotransferase family protein [Myxococcota bacterium]
MLELAFRPDRRIPEPVSRQLAQHLRGLIQAGRLAAGEKLPATRELAGALGLGRNTVTQAYLALGELGLVTSHVGQGTFVAARRQGEVRQRVRSLRADVLSPQGSLAAVEPRSFAWGGLFALRARDFPLPATLRRIELGRAFPFDFRGGQVDRASFPVKDLARACARALVRQGPDLAGHQDPRGWPPLREQVARALVARGIVCGSEDVVIVGGAQQALDLVGRVLLDPGDTVALEQPGYFGAALAFRACGANLVGIGVDTGGLRTVELARLLRARRVKLLYTTPAVQSPTGVALEQGRRHALLELADQHQVPILEDDYDSELRLSAPASPALKTLDHAGQVVYVGTFSKALFPGLRVGYIVAARPLLDRIAAAHLAASFQTSTLAQAALVELSTAGAFERHVRRVRRLYSERLAVLLEAVGQELPEGTLAAAPAGGTALWVRLPPRADPDAILAAALEAGVVYARGDAFFLDGSGSDCLSLGFANLSPGRIAEGVAILGRIVRAHTGRTVQGRGLRSSGRRM